MLKNIEANIQEEKVTVYDCRKYNGHTLTHQFCQVYRTMIEEMKNKMLT